MKDMEGGRRRGIMNHKEVEVFPVFQISLTSHSGYSGVLRQPHIK